MCRTRQEIIDDEVEVQKLISIKERLEDGERNGFENGRMIFELTKLESQIESTIREFMQGDRQIEQADELKELRISSKKGWEMHYEFHRKNPSLVALFKKSPIGTLSLGGAGLTATSLFYVQESRDALFSLLNLKAATGQSLLNIGFPLFVFLLITGVVAFTNAGDNVK